MDKVAVNNLLTSLKKEIKKSKGMVAQRIVRKIKELKKQRENVEDEAQLQQIEKAIDRHHSDIKLLKSLDPYLISKKAILRLDSNEWKKMINNAKFKKEDQLCAQIVTKNTFRSKLDTFVKERPDMSEWIEEYFSFREKKKEIEAAPNRMKKA